jgi:HNH endonuclease
VVAEKSLSSVIQLFTKGIESKFPSICGGEGKMNPAREMLRRIYDRTCGYCHLCGKKLSFQNYGRFEKRRAWEIEHSIPRAMGGSDHLNNLYPACIGCNRDESTAICARPYGQLTPLYARAVIAHAYRNQFTHFLTGVFSKMEGG